MTTLDAKSHRRLQRFQNAEQLPLDELIQEAEAALQEPLEDLPVIQASGRNGHDCDCEATCHAEHGIGGNGYICGFRVAGTTWACPRRRRGGHAPEIVKRPVTEPEPVEGLVIAPRRNGGGKKMLWWTKKDGTSEEIVALYPGEYRPPKRW